MNKKQELDDLNQTLWIAGHLKGAARELRELLEFLGDERDALVSQTDSFSHGGVAALTLALVHIRQRVGGLNRAGSALETAVSEMGVELPDVEMLVIVKLSPDTEVQCNECGGMPTVRATFQDGTTTNTHQCGPCFFGDPACRNPQTWNDPQNVK
jgi:hypothetical protein